MREPLTYADALKEATGQLMRSDSRVFVMGLGVPQGTGGIASLAAEFPGRVLDTPTSEAALTGLAAGAAMGGLKPIVYHDRVEFSLLASDQLFTQAAKWRYMFGGEGGSAPIIARIVVGRQWGNGPQHSQAFYGMFGSVNGLRTVIPSTPYMAKGLLAAAAHCDDPVVILEPRWIYGIKQQVPEELYEVPLDKARIAKEGSDLTVVAYGDGYVETLEALTLIPPEISVELIDLVSLKPIDHETIAGSVAKTGKILTVDTTSGAFSIGSEVIAKVAQNPTGLMAAPAAVCAPDVPVPTSPALSEHWYPTKVDIANAILTLLGREKITAELSFKELHIAPSSVLE
jgi:pyruvate dehydrogenase E1 component beta subunit